MNPLARLICLALVGSALLHTTSAFATLDRSIKHCIPTENATEDKCQELCKTQVPKRKWVSPIRVELDTAEDGQTQCCCKYDDFWRINADDNWFKMGREMTDHMRKFLVQTHECETFLIRYSNEIEETAYKTMCKYLEERIPLTMLELAEFIQAVTYLRSNQPKSRRIKKILNQDYIPKFTKEMEEVFEQNLDSLLDHKRDPMNPSGPPFELDELEKLAELTTKLREILDIDMVHRAFDELIISQVMISVLGARRFYSEINQTIPYKSFESLRGNVGGEPPQDPLEVQIEDFSCKKFINARDILQRVVESVESILKSLKIEGTFYEMMINWTPFFKLQRSIIVYNKLILARCPQQVNGENTETQ